MRVKKGYEDTFAQWQAAASQVHENLNVSQGLKNIEAVSRRAACTAPVYLFLGRQQYS